MKLGHYISGLNRLGAKWLAHWAGGFVVVACVMLFVSGVAPEYAMYRHTWGATENEMSNLARLFLLHAEDTFEMADSDLVSMRGILEGARSKQQASDSLRLFLSGRPSTARLRGLRVLAVDGSLMMSSMQDDYSRHQGDDQTAFASHKDVSERGIRIGVPIQSQSSGEWIVLVTRRFDNDNGTFGGVVCAEIDLEYFVRLYAKTISSHRISVNLLRSDGTLIVRYPFSEKFMGVNVSTVSAFLETVNSSPVGIVYTVSIIDKIKRLVSYNKSSELPLVSMVTIAADDVLGVWLGGAIERTLQRLLMVLVIGALGSWLVVHLRQRQKMNLVLAEREAQFRLLAEVARDAVLCLDHDGSIVYVSPVSSEVMGLSENEILGKSIYNLEYGDDSDKLRIAVDEVRRGEAPSRRVSCRATWGAQERWHAIFLSSAATGLAQVLIATVRDVTEEREEGERLIHDAMTDVLTGVANRRRLDAVLAVEWRRANRGGGVISLLFVDGDNFKSFNDTYGHNRGDLCISAIAASISSVVRRDSDLVARFGGEEFIVLLPETDSSSARCIAEKIRIAVEALAIPHSGNGAYGIVTVSVGVATEYPSRAGSGGLEGLKERADAALYSAKSLGRNRVETADAGLFEPEIAWLEDSLTDEALSSAERGDGSVARPSEASAGHAGSSGKGV